MRKNNSAKFNPIIIAFISLIVFSYFIFQYTQFSNENKEKSVRANLYDQLITKKEQLEKALNSRIYYTKGVAAYISINPDIKNKEFRQLADELIQKDTVIGTMSISKDCIINAIYPIEGHEKAIGLNLLAHPEREEIVKKTIETRETFVAGPAELVEGGIAFLSYTPIFTKDKSDTSKFWGVTDIVIIKDRLFNEIKLTPTDSVYKYALRGVNGTGKNGEIFFGDPEIFNQEPVLVDILLPTGKWVLASAPINGWKTYLNKIEMMTIFLYISAFIISFLIWLLARAMIKIRNHEVELETIFSSMNDLIIEFNTEGRYVKIAPTNLNLLVKPREKMLGKTINEVFDKDKETASFFMKAITDCFSKKEQIFIDYPLIIDDKKFWFTARLSYINENSLLYVAHDNTTKKIAEEKLKESEKELRKLNSTKDRLFSIIAHDLRSPFNATLGLTKILKEDFDELSKIEITEILNQIQISGEAQIRLLENLLSWAQLQTNRMQVKKEEIILKNLIKDVLSVLEANLTSKEIKLINNIEEDIVVSSDKMMLSSIIQNLITNSIKFTLPHGTITLDACQNNSTLEFVVRDTGVGIKKEKLSTLFDLSEQFSERGTAGEKGSGLGLTIVKEMVDKLGGEISVTSKINEGSKFIIKLPLN